jgi:membrane associated rhomboid family serine protease
MARVPSRYGSSVSFGPGPLSPAMKGLIGANVAVFVLNLLLGSTGFNADWYFSLRPDWIVRTFSVWQLVTYMFLHGGVFHLLFNMLTLWMFGTELERIWGSRYFLKFYFLTGIGAGALTVLASLLPFEFTSALYGARIVGASGAIYGLLLAYALYFPDRPIYMYMVFPIPAKYFVMIMGALAFYASLADNSGIANATHLSGLLIGYLLLKGARVDPIGELRYRYLRWKMGRGRRKFEVYSGGRSDDWDRRIH